jgi:toxin ParE1/3/4
LRIEWLPAAERNLRSIIDFIRKDNPRAARSVAEKVVYAVQSLAENPMQGRSGRVLGTRELVIPGTPYIVPYAIGQTTIIVIRVIHGAQRWPSEF